MRKLYIVLIIIFAVLLLLGIYVFIQYKIAKDNVTHMQTGASMMLNETGTVAGTIAFGELNASSYNINMSSGFIECNKMTYMNGVCYVFWSIKMMRNNETITREFCESIPTDNNEPFWMRGWLRKNPRNFKESCYEFMEFQQNRLLNVSSNSSN